MTSLIYRDAAGIVHEVVVRKTVEGDWEVLDTCAGEGLVIERLDGRVDGEAQDDAIAGDYVATGRFVPVTGRNGGEAIPEQGGADADTDCRSAFTARSPHARETALSGQAG